MFYDLNVPWTSNDVENQRKIAFLAERELYQTPSIPTSILTVPQ